MSQDMRMGKVDVGEKSAREKLLQSLPRSSRRRLLRKTVKGEWRDIAVPAGSNRAMRRKKVKKW